MGSDLGRCKKALKEARKGEESLKCSLPSLARGWSGENAQDRCPSTVRVLCKNLEAVCFHVDDHLKIIPKVSIFRAIRMTPLCRSFPTQLQGPSPQVCL